MPIQTLTTATTPDGDWDGHMIEVQDSYWLTYLSSEGTSDLQQVYNTGLEQGFITIIGDA